MALVAMLVLSVPVAVAAGVGLAILMFLVSSASDLRAVTLECTERGHVAEVPPPEDLQSETVTVLNVYGSLSFAGTKTLQDLLQEIGDVHRPVVVLRMRGRTSVGSTLIDMLDDYAEVLAEVGGRLYLTGLREDVLEQLRRTKKLGPGENVYAHEATGNIGESTADAVRDANGWLGRTDAKSGPMMVP